MLFFIYLIIFIVLLKLVFIIAAMASPPYWPLKEPWSAVQQSKAWTLVCIVIDVLLLLQIKVHDRSVPPGYDANFLIPDLLLLCLCLIVTAIVGSIMLRKQRNNDDDESTTFEEDLDSRSFLKHWPRNTVFLGFLGLSLWCMGAMLVDLSGPAPEFPDRPNIENTDAPLSFVPDTAKVIQLTNYMVLVEGGQMTLGLTPEQGEAVSEEQYAHKATVKDFYLARCEVTVELWNSVMGYSEHSGYNSQPVSNVSWDDCMEFISRLDSITGKHYRLPTEDEWEYAARGGKFSHGYKYAGSNDFHAVVIPNESGSPYPVCGGSPNELKLYEMSSGVSEWVTGTSGNPDSICVARGGSSYYGPELCRVSSRNVYPHDYTDRYLGFRLAMDAE